MIPNNNLSVLPWYTSLEQQNARKWWVYNRVYPLFTPAGYILPFQLIRDHRTEYAELENEEYDSGYLTRDGDWEEGIGNDYGVTVYNVTDVTDVHLIVPSPYPGGVTAVAKNGDGDVLGIFEPRFIGVYEGNWHLPTGTTTLYVQTYNASIDVDSVVEEDTMDIAPVESFKVYTKENVLVAEIDPTDAGITIVPFADLGYDIIVFTGSLPVVGSMDNGQYYATIADRAQTWYSEIFTVVNDISGYLKLEWWDREDFVMDAGTIVYKSAGFKNILYLCSDIAKPEYDFDDQVIERGGYTFPVEQVSKKRYRFSFFASEYLLDVLRFVRMADYAQITSHGQLYTMDTFLITPEWEDNGDVAGVDAEFTTATVAKKIGVGYIKSQRLDFNDDFNDDFN